MPPIDTHERKVFVDTGVVGRCEVRTGFYRGGGFFLSLIRTDGEHTGESWRDLTIPTPEYLRDQMDKDCALVPWNGISAAIVPQLEAKLILSRTKRVARFDDGEIAAVCKIAPR